MTPRILVDLALRTKSGPRLRGGLREALCYEWGVRGWPLHVLVPGDRTTDDFDVPEGTGKVVLQPEYSDLVLEERWLPRLFRDYDVVITQRECVRRTAGSPGLVLQLHEHVSTRYSPTQDVRAAARLAVQRLRTAQTYARAAHVCFSSSWTCERFQQLEGHLPGSYSVVPLAGWPDGELPDTLERSVSMSGNASYVLAVASNDARDDLDWGLRVWAGLADHFHEMHVVGEARTSSASGVRFLGRVSDAALREQLTGAAIYLHLGRVEGFGLSLVEAMQMGVPVVALAGSATEEVLAGGGGIVVRSAEEGSRAALELLRSADGARTAALAAGRRYQWSSTARGWANAVACVTKA